MVTKENQRFLLVYKVMNDIVGSIFIKGIIQVIAGKLNSKSSHLIT
jgi:hypothetical protein